jgi:hypothetical protein
MARTCTNMYKVKFHLMGKVDKVRMSIGVPRMSLKCLGYMVHTKFTNTNIFY